MHQRFLAAAFIFAFFPHALFSLYNNPHPLKKGNTRLSSRENEVQKAMIYFKQAGRIQDTQIQKSFTFIVAAYRIAIEENIDSLKAKARMKMGDYSLRKRRFMKANEHFLAALKTYQNLADTNGEISAYSSIALVNRILGDYDPALQYLQQALALAQKANLRTKLGELLEHVAITYQLKGYRKTARYYFDQAISVYRETGNRKCELMVRNNMGSIYLDEERYEEGKELFLKLLREADTSYRELRGTLYTRLGHIYYEQKDFRRSLHYNRMALKVRQRGNIYVSANSSLINIAGDYYRLDKPDSGAIYMDSGMILAARYDRKNIIENGYRHLYEYHLRHGDLKQALNYYARYITVHDDINREKFRNKISTLMANRQLQQTQHAGRLIARQHDIQTLNLKGHNYQSLILLILVGLACVSMLVVFSWWIIVRRTRRQMQELNVQLSDEIRERESTERQTREREKQYKFITDHTIDFITHLDEHKKRIYASAASEKVYGYKPEEMLELSFLQLMHPDHRANAEKKFTEMVESRTSRDFIYEATKKDGTVFWVETTFNPLYDPISGVFKGVVGVTRDIQERKTKEFEIMEGTRQKENLLKEIHHRVKNNFAILVSLINMQIGQTKNQELLQSLTNLQLRIRTMALVHEMLYRSNDFEKISFPGYLRSLASVIAGTYNRKNVQLAIEAEETIMDIEALIPLGLIINEILSNAYKHAFPGERAGKILVRYTIDPLTGTNTLLLQDDGVGLADKGALDHLRNMGLQVVQILCTQIEATLAVTNDPGASFTITFQPPVK